MNAQVNYQYHESNVTCWVVCKNRLLRIILYCFFVLDNKDENIVLEKEEERLLPFRLIQFV